MAPLESCARESRRKAESPHATTTVWPERSAAIPSPDGSRRRRGGPMRNSPRSGSSWTGHRWMPPASGESVSRSPDDSNNAYQVSPICSEASSVPWARSQSTTPPSVHTASTRPSLWNCACPNPPGSPEGWARVRYSSAGSTSYVVRASSWATTILPSGLNSNCSEYTSAFKLSTGRPRIGSQSRNRFSHPLLASSVPEGWKSTRKTLLDDPSRTAFRRPVAASQR